MNIAIIIIISLLICIEVYPCDEKHIICSTVCVHEGDELGVMINDKCYCANSRDVSKVITKVPKNGAVVINKPPQPRYFFE